MKEPRFDLRLFITVAACALALALWWALQSAMRLGLV